MKSSISITHENCEGSTSSTVRTRNLRRTSIAPAMPWKIIKSGASNKVKSKLACILEASESTRLRGENHCRLIMKTTLQEKETMHYSIKIWFTHFPMPQAMKIPAAKAAVDKKWWKLEKFSAWNLTKDRSKKEVIDEARTKGAKVHFASLMDICHLKKAELEAKHQKYKGRVVFRGDIVKDDSSSYAVFTEQGSSASQMTAAKVISYPDCQVAQDEQLTQYLLTPR